MDGTAGSGVDLHAVRSAGRSLLDATTRRAAADEAAVALRDVVGVEYAQVYLENDSPSLLMGAAATAAAAERFDFENIVESPDGVVGEALDTGETVVRTDPDVGLSAGPDGARSWCVVPLDGEGAIVVVSPDANGFDDGVVTAVDVVGAFMEAACKRLAGSDEGDGGDARLEALSRAFPDYAFHYDADGTYLDVLLGWTNIQLYRREELLGNTVHDVLDEDLAETLHGVIRSAIDEQDVQVVEYTVETPGGEYHYEARAVPVLDDGGEDTVVLVARDITERFERERELERQNERLDEFASIVSHDLRNPLNTAKGYLDLAREEHDSPHLEEVAASHERMENLVEELLELARKGQTVENPEPVPVRELAEAAWQMAAGGSATLELRDGLDEVLADGPRLRQLFENLFRNAVEHGSTSPASQARQDPAGASSGEPSVADAPEDAVEHGSTSSRPEADDAVEHAGAGVTVTVGPLPDGFYVEDDGPGIPEGERDQVFEPGHTSSEDGTGLGLSIVNRIAEAHGWTVEVAEPEHCDGARFEVTGVSEPDG